MAGSSSQAVVGVDVSTTAVKAIAWDTAGQALAEARQPLTTRRPDAERFEQDADEWYSALCTCLRALTATVPPARIQALALAHQRETIVPLDADGAPTGPAMLWLDGRARAWIERLSPVIDATTLRRITGKTPNYGLSLYKIAWLRDAEPERFARTARFADIQGYLAERLTNRFVTSYAAADPTGLFDISAHAWNGSLCEAIGISARQLPQVVAPGTIIDSLTEEAAAATGLAPGTPLVAAGGDGQCAGLGVGAVTPGQAYLNLGTAVVAGVPCDEAATDPAWRTLCRAGTQGYYLESSLRSGALLSDWLLKDVFGLDPDTDPTTLADLERAAANRPPGADGLLLLPYWQGVMNPHWDERARGAVLGLASGHDRASLYLAVIEGIAMEQALFLDATHRHAGANVETVLAMGGLAASGLWCQTLADVTGRCIARSRSVEAASLGAGMCASAGIGLHASPDAAVSAMAGETDATFHPDPRRLARYRDLLAIYADLYRQVRPLLDRLDAFRSRR